MLKVISLISVTVTKRLLLSALLLLALTACKPGTYYPFGGGTGQMKTTHSVGASVTSTTQKNTSPAKVAHEIETTDIIAS